MEIASIVLVELMRYQQLVQYYTDGKQDFSH